MFKNEFMKEKINDASIQNVVREMVIESEQKYKTVLENSLVGIVILADDSVEYANPRAGAMFGYKGDEYKAVKIMDFIHPDFRDIIAERIRKRMMGEDIADEIEIKALKKDGTIIDILLKSACINYLGKPALIVNIVDITELKNAQKEIKELSLIVRSALIPILKLDSGGHIRYMNQSAEKLFVTELEYFKGKALSDLITGVEPAEMQEHVIQQTRKGGFDSTILCKKATGAPVKMRLTTAPLVNDKNEMTAIACFLVDPDMEQAEKNLLNIEDSDSSNI